MITAARPIVPKLSNDTRVLMAISQWVLDHGHSPAVRDLMAETGLSSGAVTYRLGLLRMRGLVDWHPYHARTLRLTPRGNLALGDVCGLDIPHEWSDVDHVMGRANDPDARSHECLYCDTCGAFECGEEE